MMYVAEITFRTEPFEAENLVDLFPGTGAVSRAWQNWRAQGSLFKVPA